MSNFCRSNLFLRHCENSHKTRSLFGTTDNTIFDGDSVKLILFDTSKNVFVLCILFTLVNSETKVFVGNAGNNIWEDGNNWVI